MDKLPVFFYHTSPAKGYRITFAGKIQALINFILNPNK